MLRRVAKEGACEPVEYVHSTRIHKVCKKVYFLSFTEHNVLAEIIRTIENNHKTEEFCRPLVIHLKKIGPDKFDIYSEIELAVTEYNVTLVFKMRRDEENAMTYTLPDCSLEPDERLAAPLRKRWLGLF
jgi:hypothetical protein